RWGGKEMRGWTMVWMVLVAMLGGAVGSLHAEDIGCVSTTFRVLGANDQICVSAFDDPHVPGVTCHLSQARTGGVKGSLGVAEDRARFAIACRQVGPITGQRGPACIAVARTRLSRMPRHSYVEAWRQRQHRAGETGLQRAQKLPSQAFWGASTHSWVAISCGSKVVEVHVPGVYFSSR